MPPPPPGISDQPLQIRRIVGCPQIKRVVIAVWQGRAAFGQQPRCGNQPVGGGEPAQLAERIAHAVVQVPERDRDHVAAQLELVQVRYGLLRLRGAQARRELDADWDVDDLDAGTVTLPARYEIRYRTTLTDLTTPG